MMVSRALTWLCEEPLHSFTLNRVFRRGWPGLANFFLLPSLLELGRAARLVEGTIFLDGMAGFVYFGGLPLGSLGNKAGLTDAFELALMVKALALIAGELVQWTLKIAGYLIGGADTQVDRILDPKNDITLGSLQRAAVMVGRRVTIELVKRGRELSGGSDCV